MVNAYNGQGLTIHDMSGVVQLSPGHNSELSLDVTFKSSFYVSPNVPCFILLIVASSAVIVCFLWDEGCLFCLSSTNSAKRWSVSLPEILGVSNYSEALPYLPFYVDDG